MTNCINCKSLSLRLEFQIKTFYMHTMIAKKFTVKGGQITKVHVLITLLDINHCLVLCDL